MQKDLKNDERSTRSRSSVNRCVGELLVRPLEADEARERVTVSNHAFPCFFQVGKERAHQLLLDAHPQVLCGRWTICPFPVSLVVVISKDFIAPDRSQDLHQDVCTPFCTSVPLGPAFGGLFHDCLVIVE
jgi:hypothetical protein